MSFLAQARALVSAHFMSPGSQLDGSPAHPVGEGATPSPGVLPRVREEEGGLAGVSSDASVISSRSNGWRVDLASAIEAASDIHRELAMAAADDDADDDDDDGGWGEDEGEVKALSLGPSLQVLPRVGVYPRRAAPRKLLASPAAPAGERRPFAAAAPSLPPPPPPQNAASSSLVPSTAAVAPTAQRLEAPAPSFSECGTGPDSPPSSTEKKRYLTISPKKEPSPPQVRAPQPAQDAAVDALGAPSSTSAEVSLFAGDSASEGGPAVGAAQEAAGANATIALLPAVDAAADAGKPLLSHHFGPGSGNGETNREDAAMASAVESPPALSQRSKEAMGTASLAGASSSGEMSTTSTTTTTKLSSSSSSSGSSGGGLSSLASLSSFSTSSLSGGGGSRGTAHSAAALSSTGGGAAALGRVDEGPAGAAGASFLRESSYLDLARSVQSVSDATTSSATPPTSLSPPPPPPPRNALDGHERPQQEEQQKWDLLHRQEEERRQSAERVDRIVSSAKKLAASVLRQVGEVDASLSASRSRSERLSREIRSVSSLSASSFSTPRASPPLFSSSHSRSGTSTGPLSSSFARLRFSPEAMAQSRGRGDATDGDGDARAEDVGTALDGAGAGLTFPSDDGPLGAPVAAHTTIEERPLFTVDGVTATPPTAPIASTLRSATLPASAPLLAASSSYRSSPPPLARSSPALAATHARFGPFGSASPSEPRFSSSRFLDKGASPPNALHPPPMRTSAATSGYSSSPIETADLRYRSLVAERKQRSEACNRCLQAVQEQQQEGSGLLAAAAVGSSSSAPAASFVDAPSADSAPEKRTASASAVSAFAPLFSPLPVGYDERRLRHPPPPPFDDKGGGSSSLQTNRIRSSLAALASRVGSSVPSSALSTAPTSSADASRSAPAPQSGRESRGRGTGGGANKSEPAQFPRGGSGQGSGRVDVNGAVLSSSGSAAVVGDESDEHDLVARLCAIVGADARDGPDSALASVARVVREGDVLAVAVKSLALATQMLSASLLEMRRESP